MDDTIFIIISICWPVGIPVAFAIGEWFEWDQDIMAPCIVLWPFTIVFWPFTIVFGLCFLLSWFFIGYPLKKFFTWFRIKIKDIKRKRKKI